MRIAVVGIGGVGGYFGGKLAQAGVDTIFIARGATLEALRKRGLRVDSINGDFTVDRVNATDDPAGVGPVDAVIFATKAWQIPEAAQNAKALIGKDTIAVPLENGMEAPDQLSAVFGREHVLGGLCGIVSFIVAPGHIKHAAIDPFVMFGELDNSKSDRAERLRETFERAGIKADIPADIHRSMWSKFLFIAPMSAIGALTRVPIGVWRAIPETREIAIRALREMTAVAAARGASLPGDAVDRTLERYDAMAPDSTSSLQRDIMEGKPSELEAQAGAIVRMARASRVETPVCDMLYGLLLPQERKVRGSMSGR
ncbi:MAG TPA: 2-dehydropantoate 2-reductase [Thermoanaerobaculia bacterium]|nr:2-dehydropantoate 2-reductase [Thermoanaerobaculia bacterium]